MIKSKFKRVTSLFLATLMCVTTFAGIGSTTAYAASLITMGYGDTAI